MKVRALQLGYSRELRRIRPGEIFELKPYKKTIVHRDEKTRKVIKEEVVTVQPEQQLAKWMEPVEDEAVASKKKAPVAPASGASAKVKAQDVL